MEQLTKLQDNFPSTVKKAKKLLGLDIDKFQKFVCCPTCNKLYQYSSAVYVDAKSGEKNSKNCDNVPYPNHIQARFRQKCGTVLMKTVVSADGKNKYLYPRKVYVYQSIKESLTNMLKRKDFKDSLLSTPKFSIDALNDIYDGDVYKTFLDVHGKNYFSDPRNLGVMMNIDWFQPYENVEYSLGVMYLVIINLPRKLRFREENVIVIGVIPCPSEPRHDVNTFLRPFVEEMLLLWNGVAVDEDRDTCLCKMALICCSSDLPATRKLCGFVSFSALHGMFITKILKRKFVCKQAFTSLI